jgi:hypothetical protein
VKIGVSDDTSCGSRRPRGGHHWLRFVALGLTVHAGGASLSADYAVLVDRLRVEIDTGRDRLENAEIIKADGTTIRAQTIEHAPLQSSNPRSVGPGVGSYRWGSSTGGRVGGGVSTGGDIDSNWVGGNTLAFFALDQVGPAPWRLRVTLAGREPVVIVLDASTGGR